MQDNRNDERRHLTLVPPSPSAGEQAVSQARALGDKLPGEAGRNWHRIAAALGVGDDDPARRCYGELATVIERYLPHVPESDERDVMEKALGSFRRAAR